MSVPAGVIGYFQVAAVVALILMAAKDSGSAYLAGAHNPQMIAGQPMECGTLLTTLTSLFVERGHRRGTWWKIYTLHLSGFMVEESHASSSRIKRSWHFV